MIRNQKNKLLTLLVAGVIGTAALGGAVMSSYTAEAAESTYALSTIFTTSTTAKLGKNGETKGDLKMELSDGGKVSYTRDLALKWYDKDGAKYMNMDFTLMDSNFEEIVFTFEAASLTATKDNKAINKVVFAKDGKVFVNNIEAEGYTVYVDKKYTLSLNETSVEDGSFNVTLLKEGETAVVVGTFTNIGVNFAEYDTSKKIYSFAVSAETVKTVDDETDEAEEPEEKKTNVLFHQINGQSLEVNENDKFVDNADPVLVVNEDIDGYVLGTAFALDYEVIDVLDKSVTKTLKYYQYNPDDAAAAKKEYDESTEEGKEMKGPEYKTLSTTTYFLETNFTYKNDQDEEVKTTVFTKAGKEYVSIKITLSDDRGSADYFLDWYIKSEKVNTTENTDNKFVFDAVKGYTDIDYIKVYANDEEKGPTYTFLATDDRNKENDFTETQAYTDFVDALEKLWKVEENGEVKLLLSAGEGSYLYLPSMKGLFEDNGGYSNLKFTISYKTSSNNTAKTSSGLSASSLKLELTQAGIYEFKVFAEDKAGNKMKYYLDGELVDVTSSNVWSIEEIPPFTFKVANNGLKVEEETKKKEMEVLYGTYDIPSFDVIGPSDVTKQYALFYIDQSKIENTGVAKLHDISFADISEKAKELKGTEGIDESGLELYKLAYAMKVANLNDVEDARDFIEVAFREIDEYNSKIDKELHEDAWNESDNAYAWKPDSRSFSPQETGLYLVFAYFTDPDVAAFDACAYVIVSVEAEEDVIKGETQWLKNNMVSVILFGIAGLMLILIIILLVVKPSDETLEDYDEPETKKKEKKSKKEKANEKALEELDKE